jgi:prevent-host-death family protein
MDSIGVGKARTHFSQLLERVAQGETITITRRGVPVAMLVPPPSTKERDVRAAIEKLIEWRKGYTLGDLTIRELIEEGRRY